MQETCPEQLQESGLLLRNLNKVTIFQRPIVFVISRFFPAMIITLNSLTATQQLAVEAACLHFRSVGPRH